MALDFLAHLQTESARFLDVLRDADPALPVPSCPDWKADDLLWHLGEVQWFWATIVEERRQDTEGLDDPARPDSHAGLVAFFEDQSARLHRELSAASPDERVYMWAADKTVGYIRRRQAHEALIHRLDAELTTGNVTPLDAALATDGVDEVLEIMYGGCPPWGSFTGDGRVVAVSTADTGATVLVELGRFTGTDPDGTSYDDPDINVTRDGGDALATVRGTAADLDAWLWHRRDRGDITSEGDQTVLAALDTVLEQAIN